MTKRVSRWDHPLWHLVIVVPLLVFVITTDDTVIRAMAALALALQAFRFGRDSMKPARVKTSSDPDTSA
jgi:hypothetical protein